MNKIVLFSNIKGGVGKTACFPRWDTHALRGYLPQPDTTSLHSSDCSSSMPRQTRLVCLDFGSV